MFQLIGGIISVVIGICMLIVGGSIINTVSIGGTIGDCSAQDYNGDGTVNATDQSTSAFTSCNGTRNNGYAILNIISIFMIIGGVITAIRVI